MDYIFIVHYTYGNELRSALRSRSNIQPSDKYWYAFRNCPIKDRYNADRLMKNFLLVDR